jgi:hypothetical protein
MALLSRTTASISPTSKFMVASDKFYNNVSMLCQSAVKVAKTAKPTVEKLE